MEIGWDSWVVIGAPFVVIAGIVVYFLLRRHREKSTTKHMLE